MSQVAELVADASYYLAPGASNSLLASTVDVPMSEGDEVVTVDFNENPEAADLIGFLENEDAKQQYWFAIASIYFKRGSVQEAFEVAERGLQVFSNSHAFPTFVGWLYIRQAKASKTEEERESNLAKASDLIRKSLSLSKDSSLNRLALAEVHYQRRNYDQALDVYERIIKTEPNKSFSIYASIGKAKILFKRKNFNQSLKQFQAVLIENPLISPDPRLGIGLNFWKLKDKKIAIQSWERVLALDPKNESAKLLLLLSKFDSSFNSLTDDEFVESYSIALESLNELKSSISENPVILLLITSYFYSRAEYESVLKVANKVLSLPSISKNLVSDAQFWIARVHYHNGDYVKAQKFFTDSLKADEDNLLSKLGVGQSQIKRDSIEESIITFENTYTKSSKILEVNYILGVLYSYDEKTYPKAIELLEKYVRASNDLHEQVYLNALLTLSKLYENKDNNKALDYLSKSMELLKNQGGEIPIAILNNLGVYHFIKGNPESAQTFFQSALDSNTKEDLEISLLYNNARSKESSDLEYSRSKYEEILSKVPNYISARLRLLFLDIINSSDDVNSQIEELLSQHPSNLSIRSFYAWFLRKTGKSANTNQNLESSHNKETLVKYDSHDTYALISLGNLYCSIAREIKGTKPQDVEKRNQSYIRGAQLFQKVLSIDSNNIFAAQGIAIIFVENGHNSVALETFRKIRDAIDDVSVYINLGHCLIEVGQYSKAIESYEIALRRYGDDTRDSKILTLVGRSWFLRAISEKSIESFFKSLEYSKKSLGVAQANHYEKLIPSLRYNVAFVQFNIAQFILRQKVEQRTLQDLETSLTGLQEAIITFEELSELKNSPIQANILKQRASMGSNTLIKQLERSINEQKEYETQYQSKIEEAQRQRELERQRAIEEEVKRKEEEEKIQNEKREEYLKLQEQAKEWEKERESYEVVDDAAGDGEKKKRRGKKNAISTEDELSDDEVKVNKKGGKRKKKATISEEDKAAKKRKTDNAKYKSSEFIGDSDDDSDEEMDDLDAAEAKIDEQKEEEVVQDDEDDEDGLF
jgi:RNA polymerase-associated protein CTR9